ncbi:MAG: hypothetical protein QOD42_2831 [Sphingomonadales bacterium]|jgi:hypothetical protein|nr:hypothetical protein [Sphingomonadales bacterium]
MMTRSPVIPAKAGIPSRKRTALLHGAPACAGVTEVLNG